MEYFLLFSLQLPKGLLPLFSGADAHLSGALGAVWHLTFGCRHFAKLGKLSDTGEENSIHLVFVCRTVLLL